MLCFYALLGQNQVTCRLEIEWEGSYGQHSKCRYVSQFLGCGSLSCTVVFPIGKSVNQSFCLLYHVGAQRATYLNSREHNGLHHFLTKLISAKKNSTRNTALLCSDSLFMTRKTMSSFCGIIWLLSMLLTCKIEPFTFDLIYIIFWIYH